MEQMKTLLKGGRVVSGQGVKKADVLIEGSRIAQVGNDLSAEGAMVVDISGKLLFPGFIDAHTHFDLAVAGTVTADDFETGTKAAVSGGTTTVVDFATQYRGETLKEALDNWHKKADDRCYCNYGFHLAISEFNEEISRELEEVTAEGVTSFKLYMIYDDNMLDDGSIYRVLKRLTELGGIAGVHCENSDLVKSMVREQKELGHLSPSAHPASRPPLVEAEAVGRLLKIARLANAPIIVVHLSTEAGLKEVQMARKEGQEVYLETCPQYLLLDDSVYEKPDFEGGRYVIAPPLRKKSDQEALWGALNADQIQTVSTDHCSFTLGQKAAGREDFTKIPGGMAGVETRPVLIYTYGVKEGRITLEQMCRLLSENPAKLYGMYPQKGAIEPGSDADLVVWNPEEDWVLSAENQAANVDYQTYEGWPVFGKPEKVYVNGVLTAENGSVCGGKDGRYVRRKGCMPWHHFM